MQRCFVPGGFLATVTGPAFLDTDDHVEITKEVNFVSDSIWSLPDSICPLITIYRVLHLVLCGAWSYHFCQLDGVCGSVESESGDISSPTSPPSSPTPTSTASSPSASTTPSALTSQQEFLAKCPIWQFVDMTTFMESGGSLDDAVALAQCGKLPRLSNYWQYFFNTSVALLKVNVTCQIKIWKKKKNPGYQVSKKMIVFFGSHRF